MPYTPEHKEKTRSRIVDCARRMFIEHGYGGVSIDDIMAEAGLTRGGFYNHFKNKEDLFAAAIESFLNCDYMAVLGAERPDETLPPSALAHSFVNAYLSKPHLEGERGLCPLIALPTDVARAGPGIKASYQKLFEGMLGIFEKSVQPVAGKGANEQALALVATCVGGMILARAMGDEGLSDRIRAAALAAARETLDGTTVAIDKAAREDVSYSVNGTATGVTAGRLMDDAELRDKDHLNSANGRKIRNRPRQGQKTAAVS